jgi:hypothetical protein
MAAGICGGLSDELSRRCAEWLATDHEIDQLSQRWSVLETRAAREFDWFNLSRAQRRAIPIGAEMAQIEQRLDSHFKVRKKGLSALHRLPARDIHGLAGKLMIASRISRFEENGVHSFIADAVQTLATLTCPACRAPYGLIEGNRT